MRSVGWQGKSGWGFSRREAFQAGLGFLAVLAGADAGGQPLAAELAELVSGGDDRAVKLWSAQGKLSATLGMQEGPVLALGLASNMLLASGGDAGLRLWKLPPPSAPRSADGKEVLALAASSNGLLAGGGNKVIRLYDAAAGRKTAEIEAHGDAVTGLQFTPDGTRLVSACANRQMRIWKIERGAEPLRHLSSTLAHDAAITGLSLSPDGRLAATVSEDGFLKVWHTDGMGLKHRINVTGRGVLSVAFSPEGRSIATGDAEGRVRLWDAEKGNALPFNAIHGSDVTALAWTSAGKALASGGEDGNLCCWDAASGQQTAKVVAHSGAVRALVSAP